MTKPSTEDFLNGWKPAPGSANPERVHGVFCEWMIERKLALPKDGSRACAYSGRKDLGLADEYGPFEGYAPVWCFDRFGASETILSDGTRLLVGGEHEDSYDPDFCIYNDVVRIPPGGRPELYRYPEAIFPPTDFHSADVVGDEVILIGCLGYGHQRQPGVTPVYALDTGTLSIRRIETAGDSPGWIHRHDSAWDEATRSILIEGGLRVVAGASEGETRIEANFSQYALCTQTWRWHRTRDRSLWRTFGIRSGDLTAFTKRGVEDLIRLRHPSCEAPEFGVLIESTEESTDEWPYPGYRVRLAGVPMLIMERFDGQWDVVVEGVVHEEGRLIAYLDLLASRSAETYGIPYDVVPSPQNFQRPPRSTAV